MNFYNYASSILLLAIEEKAQGEIYFRYLTQLHFYYLHWLSIYIHTHTSGMVSLKNSLCNIITHT
jgi:hypothetical protein